MECQSNECLVQQTKAFITDLLSGVDLEDSMSHIIRYIMERIGDFVHSDKIFLYEVTEDSGYLKQSCCWKRPEFFVKEETFQLTEEECTYWNKRLQENKLVMADVSGKVRELLPWEMSVLQQRGADSLLLIPLFFKEKSTECMAIVNPDFSAFAPQERLWLFLGKQIGMLYHQERMNRKQFLLMEGIRSGNLSEFLINCATKRYEAIRVTKRLETVIPKTGNFMWLRDFYAGIIKSEYREELLQKSEISYLEKFLDGGQGTLTVDIEREDERGKDYWFRLEFSPVSITPQGKLEYFVLLVKDITLMKREEERHRQMVDALSSIYRDVYMVDLGKRMVYPIHVSDKMAPFISSGGIFYEKFLDCYCQYMVRDEYVESICEFLDVETLNKRLKLSGTLTRDYQMKQTGWGRIIVAPGEKNKDNSVQTVIFAVMDITEQKHREEWMQYRIEHDELTGTLNRSAFNRVTKLMEDNVMPYALVLLDIDKFKSINDTYGHAVGDEVLIALVNVLNDKMRLIDKIFRLGGDEFAIIMNRMTLSRSDDVKNAIRSVNEVTMAGINGLPAFSVSAGAAFSEKGYEEHLYQNADEALYRTKRTTRNGCSIYEEGSK